MTSFSSFIGMASFLSRSSYSSLWIIVYYRAMKDSLLSIFEMNKKVLMVKNEIYKNIIYYIMAFLYSISFDDSFNFIYMSALINLIFYLAILNMQLFIDKNKSQMLLQTLFFFVLLKIIYSIFNKYLICILFICSDLLVLQYPIHRFRIGVLLNNKSYFDIENIIIEIMICLLWFIYSTSNNFMCFFFICIINLFARICILFGYQIVMGDIGTNSKVYHFLISVFFINIRLNKTTENSIT